MAGKIRAQIEIKGADEYKEKIKSIAIAEKELQSEMKKTQAQYKGTESSSEALKAKYALLSKEVELQKKKFEEQQKMVQNAAKSQQEYGDKTDRLKRILEEASKGTGELTDEQKKAAEAAGANVKTTEELEAAVKKSEAQYEAAGRAMQVYQTAANNTEAGLISLNGELIETSKEMLGVKDDTDESAKGIKEVGEAADKSGKDVAAFGDMVKANLAAEAIIAGVKALAKGIKEVSEAALEVGSSFEASMSQVAATMGMTADEIQKGSADYKLLEEAARHCGETTKYSASEAAEALNYLALAGYDAAKAAETLPKVLDLAAAGGMELATASDLVTDAMAALGMETSELDTYIDEMARTAQKSNTSVQQLGEATLVCAGMAKTAGVDLETMNTALGVLANNGIKGAEGGTHLRNVLIALSAPTDKAEKKLQALGVSTVDVNGNMRDLQAIMNDLNAAIADMGTAEKAQAIRTIFNKTDIAAVNALLKSTSGEFSALKGEIKNSAGAASEMAKVMNDNLKGQVTILKSNLEALGISAYKVFDGELKKGVESASKAVQRLNDSVQSGDMNVSLNKMSEALGHLIERAAELSEDVLPDVIEGAAWCIEHFDLIAAGIAGIVAANATMGTVIPVMNAAVASWLAYKTANEEATVAQWLMNAAMSANPVGIVVTALAALTAGLITYAALAGDSAEETVRLSEEQKKLVDSANEVAEATAKSAGSRKEDRENMAAQKSMVANLRTELSQYVDANGRVLESNGRVKQIVAELNTIIPELGLYYDETSNSISMSTEELERNTEAMLRQAEVAAVQEQLTEIMKERIEVERELTKMEDEYQAAKEAVIETNQRRKESEEALNDAIDRNISNQRELGEAAQEARGEWEATVQTFNTVNAAHAELENRLAELNDEEQYLTETIGGTNDAMSEGAAATDEYSAAAAAAAAEIADSWAETHDAVVESIRGQINLLAEYEQATAHSKEEILKNMQEQVDGLKSWSDDIKELATKGIDEGLLQSLLEMGPQGAGYVAAFNDMTAEELAETNRLFSEAALIPEETVSQVEENFKETAKRGTQAYQEGFEEGEEEARAILAEMMEDDAKEIGEQTIDGLTEGAEGKKDEAVKSFEGVADETIKGVRGRYAINSPSKVFKEIGEYAIQGLADGVKAKEAVAKDAAVKMADAVKDTMRQGMNPDFFYSMGEMAGQGFVQGLLSKLPDVIAAAQSLADAASAIVASALEIHSPSKVFERLGQYTGEGFIIGFEDSMGDFGSVVNSMIPTTEDIERPEYTTNSTVTNYFTINGADGQDVTEIAYAVQDILNDQLMTERSAFA